jgi:hypothetical protein
VTIGGGDRTCACLTLEPFDRAPGRRRRVDASARVLAAEEECERAEAVLDGRYGRVRRGYHKLMFDEGGMVHLEITAASPPPNP